MQEFTFILDSKEGTGAQAMEMLRDPSITMNFDFGIRTGKSRRPWTFIPKVLVLQPRYEEVCVRIDWYLQDTRPLRRESCSIIPGGGARMW